MSVHNKFQPICFIIEEDMAVFVPLPYLHRGSLKITYTVPFNKSTFLRYIYISLRG